MTRVPYTLATHTDDIAVDSFAAIMKQKLAAKRLDGRHGWEDADPLHGISQDEISGMLREHVEKGDPVDVANFCMMLHHRGETIMPEDIDVSIGAVYAAMEAAKGIVPVDVGTLTAEVLDELTKARSKFPGKNVTFLALTEEVGELATAMFEESRQRVREEAIQVAVMAMRVVLDGDHTVEPWRAEHGLDPLVAPTGPDLTKRYHVYAAPHRLPYHTDDVVATFDTTGEVLKYSADHKTAFVYRDTKL